MMFKNLVLLFTLLGLICFAQQGNPNGPRFMFVEEVHDFGTLKENDNATYDFVFTNVGREPLVISNCSASCGCTVPTWPQSPILPGGRGTITVKFNTQGKNGAFNKVIYITSNAATQDGVKKSYEIYIKGSVVPAAKPVSVPTNNNIIPVKH
jgi:hypothetical protein